MTHSPDLGAALSKAREAAGHPSIKDVRDGVHDQIGVYTPTEQTIRVWHSPKAPALADPIVLAALANVYGVEVSSLHPAIAQMLPGIKELLLRSRCFATTPAAA